MSDALFSGPPPHFIVVVPGYMGSLLRSPLSGKLTWIDIGDILANLNPVGALNQMLADMAYPNPMVPAGLMDRLLYLPPFIKLEHYGRLTRYLETLGYAIDPENPAPQTRAVYTFPYDWRQNNKTSARQLKQKVEEWSDRHNGAKAWLIGHSNGGIVARWYIQQEGGDQRVSRLFLMGSPWDGAPKSMQALTQGYDFFLLKLFNRWGVQEKLKQLIRTFPSFYQLIPHTNPFLRDENNHLIDLYGDPSWLDTQQERDYLKDAQDFNRTLMQSELKVPEVLCFFGRKKATTTAGVAKRDVQGRIHSIQWTQTDLGDGTVPERSAVHPKATASHAFAVDHGSIYINPQTIPQLEWDLYGKWADMSRAVLSTEKFTVEFEPTEPAYAPGETVSLWAKVYLNDAGKTPVSGATIRVSVKMEEALPGHAEPAAGGMPKADLSETEPGYYIGTLAGIPDEGYYRLQAIVTPPFEQSILIEELILVEKDPE